MGARPVDDKASDTLVVVSGEGSWTGSSTLPHLHHFLISRRAPARVSFVAIWPKRSATAETSSGQAQVNAGRFGRLLSTMVRSGQAQPKDA